MSNWKNALLSLFPYYSSSSSDGGDEDKNDDFRLEEGIVISHERCAMERNLGWSFFTATKQRRKMDAEEQCTCERGYGGTKCRDAVCADKTVRRTACVNTGTAYATKGGKERSAIFLCVMKTM